MYSTEDPETYWCIKKDLMKTTAQKAAREVVYTLVCKKNGCTKVEIRRYATSDEQHLLGKELISGKKALRFLQATSKVRTPQPQKFPYQTVPVSRRIPFVYGKTIDAEHQKARYITEEGWASDNIIYLPVKICKMS
jgi:hypothetical protein